MNLHKKTVLISGSSGLLGTELIKQLTVDDTFNIVAMTSKVEILQEKYNNTKVKVVSNKTWKKEIIKENMTVDIFLNCAFPRSSKPEELAQGIPFTEQIVKDTIYLKIKNFINISSQSVYTQKDKEDVTETSAVQPESLYGMTKFACERVVSLLCDHHGINYSNIRLASLTGFDFDVRMTNRFVKSIVNGEQITINGGQQKISYLEVRDAARALILMMKSNSENWKPIYNLGNEESFTLLSLVKTIEEESQKYKIDDVHIEVKDGDSNYNNLMENQLFYQQFKFKPEYDLNKMINELFEKHLMEA